MASFDVRVQFAWWLKPYVYVLVLWTALRGRAPDRAHIDRLVARAVTWRLNVAPATQAKASTMPSPLQDV